MKYDYTTEKCWYCSREVRYPKLRYKAGDPVFCSTKCNKKYVADRGREQQGKYEKS